MSEAITVGSFLGTLKRKHNMHALVLVLALGFTGQYNCQNGQCQLTQQAPLQYIQPSAPAVQQAQAPVALPGHHIEYRVETRYRTETRQQCNGNSCSLVNVSVPFQTQIAYSIPDPQAKPAPAAAPKRPAPVRSTPRTVFSTPRCCEQCTCKCGDCCKPTNTVSFLPR